MKSTAVPADVDFGKILFLERSVEQWVNIITQGLNNFSSNLSLADLDCPRFAEKIDHFYKGRG